MKKTNIVKILPNIILILLIANVLTSISVNQPIHFSRENIPLESSNKNLFSIYQNSQVEFSTNSLEKIVMDTTVINSNSIYINETNNIFQSDLFYSESKISSISDIDSVVVSPSNPDETDTFTISADITITPANTINEVTLTYKINYGTATEIFMTKGSGDTYSSGSFGTYPSGTVFEYAIVAELSDDPFYFLHPSSGGYTLFTIGNSDHTAPSITNVQHSPIEPYDYETIDISATITDAAGIQSAILFCSVDGAPFSGMALSNTGSNYYTSIGTYSVGTNIEYYISATDDSYNHNVRTDNNGGSNYLITVVPVDTTAPSITNVNHTPSTPNELDNITFSADISDSSDILSANLYLSIDSGPWNSYTLNEGSGDSYSVQLGPYSKGSNIDYYIVTIDDSRNNNEAINDNGGSNYSIYVEDSDLTPPTITNADNDPNYPNESNVVTFSANVTDISGISSVLLYLRINNGGDWNNYSMSIDSGDTYSIDMGPFSTEDTIYYYIFATDSSLNNNNATNNNGGLLYSFTVGDSDDIGPTITNIYNDPSTITELDDIAIYADVQDPSGIQSVTLYYRINGGIWNSELMLLYNITQYRVFIGPWIPGTTIEYYIQASDDSLNYNISTEDNSGTYYEIYVNDSDTESPVVIDTSHSPVTPTEVDNVTISLSATDDSGIDFVELHYKVNDGVWIIITMFPITANLYQITLNSFTAGSTIYYLFILDDASLNNNTILHDNGGIPFQFTVSTTDESAPSISNVVHTPVIATTDDVITITVEITDLNGVENATLYYRIVEGVWIAVEMINTVNSTYSVSIGPFINSTTISYYIEAYDSSDDYNLARNDKLSLYFNIKVIKYSDAIIEVESINPVGFNNWIIRIYDEDRNFNDSSIQSVSVRIISTEDPLGIIVELLETTPNSGIFSGTIIFDIVERTDSDYPLLVVVNGKSFAIYYDDPHDINGDPETITSLHTWSVSSSAILTLDSDEYYTGDNSTITLIDADLNINSNQIDTVVVYVWSTIDRTGFQLLLTEVSPNAAVFVGILHFSEINTDSSQEQIYVRGESGIYIYYEDMNNEYGYINYILLTASYSSTVEPILVITSTYYPELPENGDDILVYAGLSITANVDQVILINLQNNHEILMEFSYTGTYETYFSAWLSTNVTEGELQANYQIKVIFTDDSSILSEITSVELLQGQLSVDINPLSTSVIAEIEISVYDKRKQLLINTDLLITATHQTSGEVITLYDGMVLNGSYILIIDSELNLEPGYWIIEIQTSKYGYNSDIKNFSVTIGLGVEIYPGENYIQENGMSIYVVADYHFWLVIEFIPVPLDLEIPDEYVLIEETLVRLSIINLEILEDMPFSECIITFDVEGIDPLEIIVFHKALDQGLWTEVNTDFNQQDYTLSFDVSTLGDYGVAIPKYLVPSIPGVPGFSVLDIINVVLTFSIFHIFRSKKYNK